jgi:phosphoglycolate phosphatase
MTDSASLFQAVVFDLDGTLLDTLDDLADCVNAVLTENGLPVHPNASYKNMVGKGAQNLLAVASGRDILDASVTRMQERFSMAYADGWRNKTRPYEGIAQVLRQLADRGVPMAVLSNKYDGMTRLMAAHFFAGIPFAAVIGQRPGVPDKPDPASALEISARMGVDPDKTVYFGDSGTDMLTARNAGMYPVGVLWGFRDAAELAEAGAAAIISHPGDIPALIFPHTLR